MRMTAASRQQLVDRLASEVAEHYVFPDTAKDAASTLLASYFLDERTHLSDFTYREGKRIEQRWSLDVVPGPCYGEKKELFILTSRDTFSAGEDLPYALKNLKRATLVGETSGGGANSGDDVRLLPHFSAFVPMGRMVSPVTKTNWEGVGVAPDVGVCAAKSAGPGCT